MPNLIITPDDLDAFKTELISEIRLLLEKQTSRGLKKYLKSSEVIKMLRISPGTLQTLRINGTLPYSKIGGIIFYDADEIQDLMNVSKIQHK